MTRRRREQALEDVERLEPTVAAHLQWRHLFAIVAAVGTHIGKKTVSQFLCGNGVNDEHFCVSGQNTAYVRCDDYCCPELLMSVHANLAPKEDRRS